MFIIAYGYRIKEEGQDTLMHIAELSADNFAQATLPGAFLVDAIPACTLHVLVMCLER